MFLLSGYRVRREICNCLKEKDFSLLALITKYSWHCQRSLQNFILQAIVILISLQDIFHLIKSVSSSILTWPSLLHFFLENPILYLTMKVSIRASMTLFFRPLYLQNSQLTSYQLKLFVVNNLWRSIFILFMVGTRR